MLATTLTTLFSYIISRTAILVTILIIFERVIRIKIPAKYRFIALSIGVVVYFPARMLFYSDYLLDIALLYFLAVKFGNLSKGTWLRWFYAFYPKVMFELPARFLVFNIFSIFYPNIVNSNDELLLSLVTCLQCLGAIFINELILRIMRVDFKRLFEITDQTVMHSIIRPTIITLGVYSFIQWLSYNLTYLSLIPRDLAMDIRKYLSLIFMVSVPVFIASLNQKMTSHLELVLLKQKEKELRHLTNYSHEIERLYRDIRSFRHDYANVLASLRYGIEHNDMASVRQTFEEVTAGSANFLQSDHFEIGNLSLIRDDAIKSIFSAKLSQAAESGIQVKVEIPEEVGRPNLAPLDFIRLLSILLDNAIEGAVESNDRELQVSYFKYQRNTVLIIENSMSHQDINLAGLYERGNSSKGLDRGWGLANVREILSSYPHTNIKTSTRPGRFQQILEMG